jgi:hypothetical protein
MNHLKQLLNKSVYGTIGYISSQDDIDLLEQYILYNLHVLKEFKQIVVATNYGSPLQDKNTHLWRKYFPNCIILNSKINRGHNFGTADLDNMLFDWCKENNEEWLCKSANDVILQESLLDKEIEDADFYYINALGVGGMKQFNYNFNKMVNEDFNPQTNFYIINVNKCDYINDKKYLDKTYDYIQTIPDYNGKVWEYIKGWSCEGFLRNCIKRNNLTTHHLIPEVKYRKLLKIVLDNQIHDCSYKNIMIEGVCHFQYPDQKILILN